MQSQKDQGNIKIVDSHRSQDLQSPQQISNMGVSRQSIKRVNSNSKQISFKNSMKSSKQQSTSRLNEPHLHSQKTKNINSMNRYTSSGSMKYMSQRTYNEKLQHEQEEIDKLEKQLTKLAKTKAFDIPLFMSNETKVDVDYQQINQSLGLIELSKNGFLKKIDRLPKYDQKVHQKINSQTVKQRIHEVNPSYNQHEIQNLFPYKGEMTSMELYDFLKDNEINLQEFPEGDPMTLAMELFVDQDQNLSFEKLSQALKSFGIGELDKKDVQIIKEYLDLDGDGKVSLEDLKKIFNPDSIQFIREQQEIYQEQHPEIEKKGLGGMFPFG